MIELPWWPRVKNLPASAGDPGSILGWGRCPGEGNGNLLQCSCLGNPMDRGAWQAAVHWVVVGHNLATKQQLFYYHFISLSKLLFKNRIKIETMADNNLSPF